MSIIPNTTPLNLVFAERGKQPVTFHVLAFDMASDHPAPVCWPRPPKNARVYLTNGGHTFRQIDISSGLPMGALVSSVAWE